MFVFRQEIDSSNSWIQMRANKDGSIECFPSKSKKRRPSRPRSVVREESNYKSPSLARKDCATRIEKKMKGLLALDISSNALEKYSAENQEGVCKVNVTCTNVEYQNLKGNDATSIKTNITTVESELKWLVSPNKRNTEAQLNRVYDNAITCDKMSSDRTLKGIYGGSLTTPGTVYTLKTMFSICICFH